MKNELAQINYVDTAVRKLMRIKQPVVIYGLDYEALAILLQLKDMRNIAGIVCDDPIFFGCEINGVKVTDRILADGLVINITRKPMNRIPHITDIDWGEPENTPYIKGNW